MGLSVGCCEGRASERGTYVGILSFHRAFLFLTKWKWWHGRAMAISAIITTSCKYFSCPWHARMSISTCMASDTKTTRVSKHIMYSKQFHAYLEVWEVQFCIPTNHSTSYMCYYIVSTLYYSIYTRYKTIYNASVVDQLCSSYKNSNYHKSKNKLVPVSVRTLLISHEGVE